MQSGMLGALLQADERVRLQEISRVALLAKRARLLALQNGDDRIDFDRHPERQIGNADRCAGRQLVEPVELEDLLRLPREVEGLRGGELHPRGQLVGADAGVEPVVPRPAARVLAIELAQEIDPRGVPRSCRKAGPLVSSFVTAE